jgi:lipopolysaccharide transport system ATP-binding protein
VAAFLEPEILIVDEVLAVGDAEFQKKAIGKMQDVSKGEGRTVLFVSHNMASVQNLCTKGILLGKGGVLFQGNIESTIHNYLTGEFEVGHLNLENRKGNGTVKISDIQFFSEQKDKAPQTGKTLNILFLFQKSDNLSIDSFRLDFRIDDIMGNRLFWMSTDLIHKGQKGKSFEHSIEFIIPKLPLNEGRYIITSFLMINNEIADWVQNIAQFEVTIGDFYNSGKTIPENQSALYIDFDYSIL